MSVEQLINYHPKYEDLDHIVSTSCKNKFNIFIDLKGCSQSLYQEWAVRLLLEQSRKCRQVDCSYFYSLLQFISYHMVYSKKRNIEMNFYIFLERGESIYHTQILKTYKEHRKSSNFFGLDLASRDLFFSVLGKNYEVMNKVVNKIPKCYFICLNNMEADFIPWYILKYAKPQLQDECNIIYSTDKDMLQCLNLNNTYQFYKTYQKKTVLTKSNALNHFLKNDTFNSSEYIDLFCLILSIMGDGSDEFGGVGGIGPVKMVELLPDIKNLCNNSLDFLYDNIKNETNLFSKNGGTNNKLLNKIIEKESIISRNLKLSSFELLSRYLNDNMHTEVIEKKKKIQEILDNTNKITNWTVLHYGLNNMSMESINISDQVIQNLF